MTRRLLLCGLAALMMGCDQTQGRRLPLPTQPPPNPAPAPSPVPGRVVRPITVHKPVPRVGRRSWGHGAWPGVKHIVSSSGREERTGSITTPSCWPRHSS